jgi:hypothetical protein
MTFSKNTSALVFMTLVLAIQIRAQNNVEDPWKFPDLSATQVLLTTKYDIPMKVYVAGSSLRVDQSAAIATLFATMSDKVYELTTYPDGSHQCVVMRPDQATMLPSPFALLYGTNVKRRPAGTEVVEGHKCKIEIAQVTRTDGTIVESKVWEAEDLNGVPVKIESKLPDVKITAVYRDVVLGTPDKALLTPPNKCTPYEKMGEVVENRVIE